MEGNTLSESRCLSYPEGQLRTLLQSVAGLRSHITAVPPTPLPPASSNTSTSWQSSTGRGWETVVREVAGIRYFLVNHNTLYVIRKNMIAGITTYHGYGPPHPFSSPIRFSAPMFATLTCMSIWASFLALHNYLQNPETRTFVQAVPCIPMISRTPPPPPASSARITTGTFRSRHRLSSNDPLYKDS